MQLDIDAYLASVRRLPRPTLGQTERFARFVSSAHSWYKHLPVRPKVPFVFHLDPGAGMNRVQTRGGETALVEVTDQSTRFHYTWQKTADYRRRFGHWNYHASHGTSFRFAGEGGVVNTAPAGLKVLTASGDWAEVPAALATAGTALVSALVHPSPNLMIWARDPARFGLTEAAEGDQTGSAPEGFSALQRLHDVLLRERDAGPSFSEAAKLALPELLEASGHPFAKAGPDAWFFGAMAFEAGWDWPGDDWLERLRSAGVESRQIAAIVKHVEVESMRAMSTPMLRDKVQSPPAGSNPAPHSLESAMIEERGRQLSAMTEAMERFLAAVYPSGAHS